MENYMVINGQTIELTNEQVEELKNALNTNVCVKDVASGDPFVYCGVEFVVLDHTEIGTLIMTKDLVSDAVKFGANNNFADEACEVRKFLEEYSKKFNKDDFVEFEVDLTSDDGLKDYGTFKSMVALLTADQARKYVDILDKYKVNEWWWLVTPFSTPAHEDEELVKCVSPRGSINRDLSYCNCGVRPVCILKSNIFVSKGE